MVKIVKYPHKDDVSFNIHDDVKGCCFCLDPKTGENIGIVRYWLFDGRSFKEKESDFDERMERDKSTSKFYASKSLTI